MQGTQTETGGMGEGGLQERWGKGACRPEVGEEQAPPPWTSPMTPQEWEAGRPVPVPISVGREDSPCGLEEETPTSAAPSWAPSPLRPHHPGGWKQGHSPSGTAPSAARPPHRQEGHVAAPGHCCGAGPCCLGCAGLTASVPRQFA